MIEIETRKWLCKVLLVLLSLCWTTIVIKYILGHLQPHEVKATGLLITRVSNSLVIHFV